MQHFSLAVCYQAANHSSGLLTIVQCMQRLYEPMRSSRLCASKAPAAPNAKPRSCLLCPLLRTVMCTRLREDAAVFVREVKAGIPSQACYTLELLYLHTNTASSSSSSSSSSKSKSATHSSIVRVHRTYTLHYRSDSAVRSFAPYACHALTDGVFCRKGEAEGYTALFPGAAGAAAAKACERSTLVSYDTFTL
jgi:hypothetical protein